jgi:hypothetical protein
MATGLHPTAIHLVSPFLPVGYPLKMRKIYLAKPAFLSNRTSPNSRFTIKLLGLSIVSLFLVAGCSNHQSRSPEQRIEFYESKARHYQTLSDLQRLSPPYSITTQKGFAPKAIKGTLRMAYLMEARRYQKLAKEAKEELNQVSNQSLEVRN